MTVEVSPIVGGTVTSLADAATIAWAANQGYAYSLTLGGNRAIANPTDLTIGALYSLEVRQDATGNRVPTWGTYFRWPPAQEYAAPTLSVAPYEVDMLLFYSDGTYLTLLSINKGVWGHDIVAPSALTASTDQTAKIVLHWTDNSTDEVGFSIELFNGGMWGELDRVAAGVTTYEATGLDPGDQEYRVRSFKPGQISTPSAPATGTAL